MIALLCFILAVVVSPFKSKSRLEAENAALRYQLIVLRRKVTGRVRLSNGDRLVFIQLYRWFPSVLQVITVIRPETLVRWQSALPLSAQSVDATQALNLVRLGFRSPKSRATVH